MSLALVSTGPAFTIFVAWAIFSGGIIDNITVVSFSDELAQLVPATLAAIIRDARALAFGGVVGFPSPLKQELAQFYLSAHRASLFVLSAISFGLIALGWWSGFRKISATYRARHTVERVIKSSLMASSALAIMMTIGIVMSLLFETIAFFGKVSFFDFLFGLHWSPQGAYEGGDGEASGADYSMIFGAVPLFAGTLLITAIAISIAAPIGLMSAIYLSDFASSRFRAIAKPLLEILAGVPTVVYGFFAALTVAPAIRGWGEFIGLSVASESALAAGLVMGIMIIPFVSSLSDDVINSVPQTLRDGSAALGSTKSETIIRVVLPAALPGIVSALLLAVSRAIGETMIVVMAAGLAANLTINPLEAVTTVTVQIVTLLVGDQEFDSAKTLAAFALGLTLFCITLALNIIALRVVKKYQEQYD